MLQSLSFIYESKPSGSRQSEERCIQASFKFPCLSRGRACFAMVRRTFSAISLILLVFLWRPVSSIWMHQLGPAAGQMFQVIPFAPATNPRNTASTSTPATASPRFYTPHAQLLQTTHHVENFCRERDIFVSTCTPQRFLPVHYPIVSQSVSHVRLL